MQNITETFLIYLNGLLDAGELNIYDADIPKGAFEMARNVSRTILGKVLQDQLS